VRVRVRGGGSGPLQSLGARETSEIDLPLNVSEQSFTFVPSPQQNQYNYRYPYSTGAPLPPGATPSMAMTADVAARRSGRIDAMLKERDNLACVYAEFDAPPDSVKLKSAQPKEAHRGIVRALVNLE
jgi:hypothetical protein